MQGTEQIKFLNDFKENSIMVATAFDRGEIPKDTPEFDKAQRIYLKVKPFIQPAAEIGALTGGNCWCACRSSFGSIGGAALSFGIVRNLFKMADSFMGIRDPQGFIREAQEAVADIEEGAAF